jgi:hypothetical protein
MSETGWMVERRDHSWVGPFSDRTLLELAREKKIVGQTKIRHIKYTKNMPVQAKQIKQLSAILNFSFTDVQKHNGEDLLQYLGLDGPPVQNLNSVSVMPVLQLEETDDEKQLPNKIPFVPLDLDKRSGKSGRTIVAVSLISVVAFTILYVTTKPQQSSVSSSREPTMQLAIPSEADSTDQEPSRPTLDQEWIRVELDVLRKECNFVYVELEAYKVKFLTAEYDIRSERTYAMDPTSGRGFVQEIIKRDMLRIEYAKFVRETMAKLVRDGDSRVELLQLAGLSKERATEMVKSLVIPLINDLSQLLEDNPIPKL